MNTSSGDYTRKAVLKIIMIYVLVAGLWIIFSDKVPGYIVHDPSMIKYIPVLKDILSVVITASLLYFLIHRYINQSAGNSRMIQERDLMLQGIVKNIPGVIYQFYAADTGEYGFNYVSDKAFEIFGISHDPDMFMSSFIACVQDEDRTRLLESIREAVNSCTTWQFEGRFIRPDGQMLWVKGLSSPEREQKRLVYHGVLLDITERKRAEEELLTRTQQLEAIRLISTEITRELDLNTLLSLIHRRAAELLGVKAGLLSLYDEAEQTLTLRSWIGHGGWVKDLHFRPGEGVSGTVAAQRCGMILNDYRNSAYAIPLILDNTTVTALVAEPMISHGSLVGVVTLDNQGIDDRTFTKNDRIVLNLFATQAAIAIENARLFENARVELTRKTMTEKALLDSQKFMEAIFRHSPYSMWISDRYGNLIRMNQACKDLLRVTDEDLAGKYNIFKDNIVEEQGVMPLVKKVFEKGETVRFTLSYNSSRLQSVHLPETASLSLEVTISPVLDENKQILYAIIQHQNISEQVEAEKALRKSEAMYRTLIETSPDPIIMYDLNGKFLAANTQTARIYGVETSDELFREVENIFDVLTDSGKITAAENFHRTAADGHSHKTEYSVKLRDGSMIPMEVNSSPVYTQSGEPYAFISILRDVTERKRSERIMIAQRDIALALGKATSLKDTLRVCLEAAIRATESDSGGIYIIDPSSGDLDLTCSHGISGRFADHVSHYTRDSDRTRLVMTGNPMYLENIKELAAYHDDDIIEEGIESVALIPIQYNDMILGSMHIASHVSEKIPDYSRNALESIASQIGTSIVRVYTEEAMRESENKFRDLAEKAIVGIYLIQDNLFIYVNAEFADISGYTIGELTGGMGFSGLIYPDDLPVVRENIRKRISGEVESLRYDFSMQKKTGEIRHVEVYSSRTIYSGRPAIIGTLLDITDRRKTEEELRRLSTVIEQAVENIVITDTEGIIQYVNPAFEKNTGYSREEAIGQNPRILKSGAHEPAFYEHLWNTISSGNVWSGRITNKCKDGRLIQEDAIIGPLFSSHGELTGYVALKRDITETVRLEDHLRQAQKMESIGTLAGGIAHDFNNILAGMMGYAELAKFKTADSKVSHYLDQVLGACERAKNLVSQILAFSRQTEQKKKPVMLTPIIKEVAVFMRASLPSNIKIRQSLDVNSDVIIADATQIHQVLMNLCTNAGHAMKAAGGLLGIALCEITINNEDVPLPSMTGGRYLHLTVSDTGYGISPELLDKIFEPYFTTKEKGEGTGLGLSVVDGIVKSHGGAITVYSEVGKGSVFHIYLPLAEEPAAAGTVTDIKHLPGGNETILFIDDEQVLAQVSKLNLENLGYKVITETDPSKAIKLFSDSCETFDIVITDKTMPQMSGFDLAREIKSIREDIPIILCTGFQDREDSEKLSAIGISHFITKPVTTRTLSRAIRSVLDKNTD